MVFEDVSVGQGHFIGTLSRKVLFAHRQILRSESTTKKSLTSFNNLIFSFSKMIDTANLKFLHKNYV